MSTRLKSGKLAYTLAFASEVKEGTEIFRSFALVTAVAFLLVRGCLTAKALTSAGRGLPWGGGCASAVVSAGGHFPKHPEGSHLQGSVQMSSPGPWFKGQLSLPPFSLYPSDTTDLSCLSYSLSPVDG
ncbi:hypothetical protein H1C71_003447 [Ictidomys tridecemlineatus]|nr:hypothetical protein H1C71_003447 [Ictidomys tridecemlineatus]KAG3266814.1 hypothetical protein H1C71_003447 [Ictidomys tridecemlineatus]